MWNQNIAKSQEASDELEGRDARDNNVLHRRS